MNKTLKLVLAAAGALVLGGIGEGIGTGLLKSVAKDNTDATETAPEAATEPEVSMAEPEEVTAED